MEASSPHHYGWNPLHPFLIHDEHKLFFSLSAGFLCSFLPFLGRLCQSFTSHLNGFRPWAARTKYGALDICRIAGRAGWTSATRIIRLLRLGMARDVRRTGFLLDPLSARGVKIPSTHACFDFTLPVPAPDLRWISRCSWRPQT